MDSEQPIDFHCHGIGRFDFALPDELVLDELEGALSVEGVRSILTLYLPKQHFEAFEGFVRTYGEGRRAGRYPHVLGIALEGPLLASSGGTPESGCWQPSIDHWRRIAALGSHGLTYVVLSPDAVLVQEEKRPPSLTWIVDELCEQGVAPALGHFRKEDPRRSAAAVREICEHVARSGYGPIFTDHLFNDMPLNFKHAWRTSGERARRDEEVRETLAREWTTDNMAEVLGFVPAAIVEFAHKGVLKVCMNFDGEHVDIELCKKAVALIGSENLMMMTDRIQSAVLGGQVLHRRTDNTLLYQSGGIVAGGTQATSRQISNMSAVGIAADEILDIASRTAARALRLRECTTHRTRPQHRAAPLFPVVS